MNKRVLAVVMSACLAATMAVGCSSKDDDMDISGDGEITLADYKNLEVYEADVEVTDEYWDELVASLTSSYATTEQITEGTVDEGDSVNIDYVGTVNDGYEFSGGTASGVDITLGSSGYIDGFDESLYGAEIGDTIVASLTFPDDYANTSTDEDGNELVLAGLDVEFTITINYRNDTVTPDFDDDFVESYYSYYGCDTAEELEAYIRNQVYIGNIINAIWDDFADACTVESYDEDELESYVAYMEEQYDSQYKEYYSVDLDTYLSAMGIDRDEWDESNLETAKESIKEKMIYIALAEAEGLVPTQEEYEEEAQLYVDANGLDSLADLEEYYTKDEVVYAVIVNRVQMYLGDIVTVLEGEAPAEEDSEDTETTDESSADDETTEE